MIIVAIDPAMKSGFAAYVERDHGLTIVDSEVWPGLGKRAQKWYKFRSRHLCGAQIDATIYSGNARVSDDRSGIVAHYDMARMFSNVETLIVEDQYLGLNPASYKKVVECRMVWENIARNKWGVKNVVTVYPSQWQPMMIGSHERDDGKNYSIIAACEAMGVSNLKDMDDNEADAINILRHHMGERLGIFF